MGLIMSSQSTDVSFEAGALLGDWGKLPYVALALIFSYLPDRDKFNASLVNRMWGEGFSWPGNWRHREMIFYGACEDTVAKETAFADRFGAQLKSLRLRCWSPAQGPALDTYLRNVAKVLDIISLNSSLRELHVADVEGLGYTDDELITVNDLLFESERRAEGKARMVTILENLIQSQSELQVLDLQEVDCAWEVGLRLVKAAASSAAAGNTMHTLLLSGTFNDLPSGMAASSSPDYIQAMSSFRKLAHLRMDYRCLSCKLLDTLGTSLGDYFRQFAILCSEEDGPELPNLGDVAWKTLASSCPFLRVELTIEGNNRSIGWRNALLKPGMPLVSLRLYSEMYRQNSEYWDTTPTLELLLREYRNTLEHLSLGISHRTMSMTAEKLTAEMVSRALRLKKLKTLHLSGPIDCEAVTTLYGLLDRSHGAKNLQRVDLTIWCSSEEEIDNLWRINRTAAQNRVSKKIEVRLIPTL